MKRLLSAIIAYAQFTFSSERGPMKAVCHRREGRYTIKRAPLMELEANLSGPMAVGPGSEFTSRRRFDDVAPGAYEVPPRNLTLRFPRKNSCYSISRVQFWRASFCNWPLADRRQRLS